jgi:hypothetical protein
MLAHGLDPDILPLHPRRKADELLSSWIVRLARTNRVKVHSLCIRLGGNMAPIWTRDVDRMAPSWLISRLSQLTGRPEAEIRQATLADLAELIDVDHHPNGTSTWLLPLGIWHRQRLKFGLQFCPTCLRMDDSPYIRRAWRLAFYTECEHHHTLLADRCPACGKPHAYFRGELGNRDAVTAQSMAFCSHCGFDLGATPLERFDWPDWQTPIAVRNLQFMCDFGWMTLDGRVYQEASELLLVVRQVIKVLASPTRDGQLYDAVADQVWPQGYQALGSRGQSYERRGVAERHRLFYMAVWLLQEWPHRFEMCMRNADARRSSLLSRSPRTPSWFAGQVRDAYGPSHVRANSHWSGG